MTLNSVDSKPAWRHPWFWLVMAPLMTSIVVGLGLLTVAISGSDDRVYDDYYEQGRLINNRFEKESQARKLGIAGEITFDIAAGHLTVRFDRPVDVAAMQLLISHPAVAAQDRTLLLQKVDDRHFRLDLPMAAYTDRHYLILTGLDRAQRGLWRISGEIDFSTTQAMRFDAGLSAASR